MKKYTAMFLALLIILLSGCNGVTENLKSENILSDTTPSEFAPESESQPESEFPSEPDTESEREPELEPEPEPDPLQMMLERMSTEEKVGQIFFVRCPAQNAVEDVKNYHLGGYILFTRDFQDAAENWLTREQVMQTIASYQNAADIPLLIGSDEEGGSVTRVSRNPNLFSSRFLSPQRLLQRRDDNPDIFTADTNTRSAALLELGINVNLAPVCDVSINSGAFIYQRTLGRDAETTAAYIQEVVTAMCKSGIGSVLKHFPGYGDNVDTHTGIALDSREKSVFIQSDFLPFQAGIAAGGASTAILVSHNIMQCTDTDYPASLSPAVHQIIREELGFNGVVMTDDLAMSAVAAYVEDGTVAVQALAAGNDLILTTDYRTQIPQVIQAIQEDDFLEERLNEACLRVLRWKQALGLL